LLFSPLIATIVGVIAGLTSVRSAKMDGVADGRIAVIKGRINHESQEYKIYFHSMENPVDAVANIIVQHQTEIDSVYSASLSDSFTMALEVPSQHTK
jgi:hypothetical protein